MRKRQLPISEPVHLRCEYRENPLGIDELRPRLAWLLNDPRRGARQTAYRILAATRADALEPGKADLWDTGRVESDQSNQVAYAGQPLETGMRVFWSVCIWDHDGQPSPWSEPAWWEMGLFRKFNWEPIWKAQWIGLPRPADAGSGPCPHLRRVFHLVRPLKRARAYASALGLYRLFVNGTRVGQDCFTPGFTDYHRRVPYQTYDVTGMLQEGANAVGLLLGDGWFSGHCCFAGPRLFGNQPWGLLQLQIEYEDGASETILTDPSWKGAAGPVQQSDLLMGETYDARREVPGWSRPEFDDSGWAPVVTHRWSAVPLEAQCAPTVQVEREIRPAVRHPRPDGAVIFDLGQNIAGWVRLRVRGPAGTTVTLRHGEMLNDDGSLYTANLRSAKATDRYTLRGGEEEVYEPAFTYHGFRYVEVRGYPGEPTLDAVTGMVAHSATLFTGTFECSHSLINRLQQNIRWSQRANFFDVPTDCPQRNERAGWLGDAQIFCRTAACNADVATFFTKWLRDVEDTQKPNGAVADFAPRIPPDFDAAPGWGDALLIIPWTMYLCYGDTRLLRRHYRAMQKWVDYVHEANPDLIWRNRVGNNYADWLNVDATTPWAVVATAFFARSVDLLAQISRVVGKDAEADRYAALFHDIRDAFNRAFVTEDARILATTRWVPPHEPIPREEGTDTQTAYVLALGFDLLPPAKRIEAAEHLRRRIEERNGHLSTGFIGCAHLLPVLTQAGMHDLAYRLLMNETFPSWLYPVVNGATTMWERWDGWTKERGFNTGKEGGPDGMNSFNHYAFGAVGEWLYGTVAGLAPAEDGPGWKRIVVRPRPGGGLLWARAAVGTPYGQAVCSWNLADGRFTLEVAVPPNTTAAVHVPAPDIAAVREGDGPAANATGVRAARHADGHAVFDVAAGSYRFSAPA